MKRLFRIVLIFLLVVLLVVLVGPFLIPVRPLEGLSSPAALAQENSEFLTLIYLGTDGIDIHYRRGGEGEPAFVLLHGFAGSLFTWDTVFDDFAARGRTLAYDRPPFGLSERLVAGDWTEGNPYAPDAAVAQLFALLDQQGIDRAILVGNSAGGTLALRAALAQPERVAGLILVSPAVLAGGGTPAFVQPLLRSPQLERIGPLIARVFLGQEDGLESAAYYDAGTVTEEQRAKSRLGLQVENWDRALWEFTAASQASNLTDALADVTMPVLVVSGENDLVVPVSQSVALAEQLPDAEVVIIPACGHLAQEECPVPLLEAVNAWLADRAILENRVTGP
jgi:pimeloyl-ACP methyl ester carboxylesterase